LSEREFPPVSLEEMIAHNDLIERYPWLTAQILNKWRREKRIRTFRGKEGVVVYPMSDLVRVVNEDLRFDPDAEEEEPSFGHQPDAADSPEAVEIRERLYLAKLMNRRKGKKPSEPPAG